MALLRWVSRRLGLGAGWTNKLKGTRAAEARTRYPHLSEVVIRTIRLKTILPT